MQPQMKEWKNVPKWKTELGEVTWSEFTKVCNESDGKRVIDSYDGQLHRSLTLHLLSASLNMLSSV